MPELRPSHVVGIGGSAGALAAYKAILDDLPSDTGMAFVVISHMNAPAMSALAQILARHTTMEVRVPATGMALRQNRVYVIPPNADLRIDDGAFKVAPTASKGKQADVFLASLADTWEARAIGVLLSGYGRDGVEGLKRIKAKGGTTFAQDLSAEVDDLPLNAVASGCVDFVLPPDGIAARLRRLSASRKP